MRNTAIERMDEILLEKKVEEYYSILKSKNVSIKNLRKMKNVTAYRQDGHLKSEAEIDELIEWAKSLE